MSAGLYKTGAILITIVYLIGTSFATSWYFSTGFSGGVLSATSVIAFLLAVAVEGHNYFQQRNAKAAFKTWMKALKSQAANADELRTNFFVNAGIVFVLVCVLSFFSLSYNAETFHPFGSLLPVAAQQIVKGLMLPFLYLMTIFMVDIEIDNSDLTQRFAQRLYNRALKTSHQQFEKRFKAIERSNKNAAPIAVGLAQHLGDVESAKGTQVIDATLALVESGDISHTVSISADDEEDTPIMNGHHLQPVAYFQLSDRQKQIMMLYQQGITSTPQLAKAVGCTQSTAYSDLQRVKDWLRAHTHEEPGMMTPVSA